MQFLPVFSSNDIIVIFNNTKTKKRRKHRGIRLFQKTVVISDGDEPEIRVKNVGITVAYFNFILYDLQCIFAYELIRSMLPHGV